MQALKIYGSPRTNDKVVKAWQNGVSARNHRHSLTSISYPNGSAELFSYDLKIGERTPAGVYVIADFTESYTVIFIGSNVQLKFHEMFLEHFTSS